MAEPELELCRLESDHARPEFTSGDQDLDEFFHKDSIEACQELMCVTYAFMNDGKAVAFFSLSNDAIKKEDVPRSPLKRLLKNVPRGKQYRSLPAAKIGRLGIADDIQGGGHGTFVLDYLKFSFTNGNKTGCRFLLVDAYNRDGVPEFYEKNGFQFLDYRDADEDTRIMYFDLKRFIRD